MVDLVDKSEAELAQLMSRITSSVVRVGGRTAVRLSLNLAKGATVTPALTVISALWNLANKQAHPTQGQVSLKRFAELSQSKRELVTIDDPQVARELTRELKRHGVTWSEEKGSDGSRTFHVQGKDTELIQHALGVAAARIDEKIAQRAPELVGEQQAPERGADVVREDGVPQPEQHAAQDLRNDAPAREPAAHDGEPARDQPSVSRERDEAITDRGGHSQQREPAESQTRQTGRPLSPRDQAREKVSKRIERAVKEKKQQLKQAKDRPRQKRERSAEARENTRKR